MTNQQIRDKMGRAAVYEQLAEEAAELAQAAIKYARVLRGESPTPVPAQEAMDAIVDELSDVTLCADVAGVLPDLTQMYEKRERWCRRLNGKNDA